MIPPDPEVSDGGMLPGYATAFGVLLVFPALLVRYAKRWSTLDGIDRMLGLLLPAAVLATGLAAWILGLQANHHAFASVSPALLSASECQHLKDEAERHAALHGWQTRGIFYPTVDIPLHEIPALTEFYQRTLPSRVFPLMARTFGVAAEGLAFKDTMVFIIKYTTLAHGRPGLPMHKDSSHLSFNIALSTEHTDFEGGGTWIHLLNDTVTHHQGEALIHHSRVWHEGLPITSGVRYVLVGFIWVNGVWDYWWYLWGAWATCLTIRDSPLRPLGSLQGCTTRWEHLAFSFDTYVLNLLRSDAPAARTVAIVLLASVALLVIAAIALIYLSLQEQRIRFAIARMSRGPDVKQS